MAEWLVVPDANEPTRGRLIGSGLDFKCALGKSGVIEAALKKEGDGCTPLGQYPFGDCFTGLTVWKNQNVFWNTGK